MAFTPVADFGAADRPFRLDGKAPIKHTPGVSSTHDSLFEYSDGHQGFYGWLRVANTRIQHRAIVGLMDLPDRCWRDAYEDEAHPAEEADEAIAEEISGGM